MMENLVPMVVMTGMFAMIFGIVYLKSRENMALIEKGINPKQTQSRPRPFANLKWGLLFLGCGLGLLTAFIIDSMLPHHPKAKTEKRIEITTNRPANNDTTGTDSARKKGGEQHIVISKNGKTVEINGNLENMEHMDGDSLASELEGSGDKKITIHAGNKDDENAALYFALIAIGGGLGLFFSYKIEKREWLDKYKQDI